MKSFWRARRFIFRWRTSFKFSCTRLPTGFDAARGVKDTSRGGRYHNARFRGAAVEVGLAVEAMPPNGWSKTSLMAAAAERYSADISGLSAAMTIARRIERSYSHPIQILDFIQNRFASSQDSPPERAHDRCPPAVPLTTGFPAPTPSASSNSKEHTSRTQVSTREHAQTGLVESSFQWLPLANPFANDTPERFRTHSDQVFLWCRRGDLNPHAHNGH